MRPSTQQDPCLTVIRGQVRGSAVRTKETAHFWGTFYHRA